MSMSSSVESSTEDLDFLPLTILALPNLSGIRIKQRGVTTQDRNKTGTKSRRNNNKRQRAKRHRGPLDNWIMKEPTVKTPRRSTLGYYEGVTRLNIKKEKEYKKQNHQHKEKTQNVLHNGDYVKQQDSNSEQITSQNNINDKRKKSIRDNTLKRHKQNSTHNTDEQPEEEDVEYTQNYQEIGIASLECSSGSWSSSRPSPRTLSELSEPSVQRVSKVMASKSGMTQASTECRGPIDCWIIRKPSVRALRNFSLGYHQEAIIQERTSKLKGERSDSNRKGNNFKINTAHEKRQWLPTQETDSIIIQNKKSLVLAELVQNLNKKYNKTKVNYRMENINRLQAPQGGIIGEQLHLKQQLRQQNGKGKGKKWSQNKAVDSKQLEDNTATGNQPNWGKLLVRHLEEGSLFQVQVPTMPIQGDEPRKRIRIDLGKTNAKKKKVTITQMCKMQTPHTQLNKNNANQAHQEQQCNSNRSKVENMELPYNSTVKFNKRGKEKRKASTGITKTKTKISKVENMQLPSECKPFLKGNSMAKNEQQRRNKNKTQKTKK